MSSGHPFPAPAAVHPLQALGQQAQRQPTAPALRWRQDGGWVTLSWSQLARRVSAATQGWKALGVQAGDSVLVLSPGFEAPVVSLLALLSLGAHLRAATPQRWAAGLHASRFALARGTQDVDRLLAHAGPALSTIVVENDFGTEPSPRVKVIGWPALLQSGARGDETLWLPETDDVAWVTEAADGQPRGWSLAALLAGQAAQAGGPAPTRVLAEFEPGWVPGVRWLLTDWLGTGAQLVLAEPGSPAGAAWPVAGAGLWLVSGTALNEWARQVLQRAGRRPAAWALGGGRHAMLGGLLQERIRQALGLPRQLQVTTDADASAQAVALLQQLGATVRPEELHSPGVAALPVQAAARPSTRGDRLEPLLTQVST